MADKSANLERFGRARPVINERLIVRCVKVYADGALGSRGALLKQPYLDTPGQHGLLLNTREHFDSLATWCREHGFQMATHCIGDSANKLILDVYGRALGGTNDLRWRIEHVQCMDPADWPLLAWPLDHIFVTPHFRLMGIDRMRDIGSDHFAMLFDLCLVRDPRRRIVAPRAAAEVREDAGEQVEEGHEERAEEQ